jgi:peptide deformylase
MTIQPIRLFGDQILREPAQEVRDFDAELRHLVRDLTETMQDAPGRGLAAPQIGVGLRVFTYREDKESEPGHLINPRLSFPDEEEQFGPEGCLSIPGLAFDCRRRKNVIATGFTMYGEPVTIAGSDVLARIIQHETDHLDGILFVDVLDPETKAAAEQAIREAEWSGGKVPEIRQSPHPTYGSVR